MTESKHYSKIEETQSKFNEWCNSIGITSIADLNAAIDSGQGRRLINLCEAYQERKYAEVANELYQHKGTQRILMLAGPSSSGKTSSSIRIAYQSAVLGLNPKVIELDNYFVEREQTPRDEKGEYDFECIGAMDTKLFNQQINDLLSGREVIIPRYNFKEGRKTFDPANSMRLEDNDILMMEGIHAINPEFTKEIDNDRIFKVYVSALTALTSIQGIPGSTVDKRLIRRIVRDNRTRGILPEQNILRWPSVRRGELLNIVPYRDNADVVFNSSMLYELSLLKYYAEPLLHGIMESSPAYSEAQRLISWLSEVRTLPVEDMAAVPPTSIMREFIGGQMLD